MNRLGKETDFAVLQNVHTGIVAHPAFHSIVTRAISPGVNRPRREVDHSSPSSAEVKNEWSHTAPPSYAFMACPFVVLFEWLSLCKLVYSCL